MIHVDEVFRDYVARFILISVFYYYILKVIEQTITLLGKATIWNVVASDWECHVLTQVMNTWIHEYMSTRLFHTKSALHNSF
jgi:hypothetical protein